MAGADGRDGMPLLAAAAAAFDTQCDSGAAELAGGPYSDGWLDSDRERVWRSAAAVVRRADAREAAEAAGGANADADGDAVYIPSFLSRRPAVLRAQGYFLLALGSFVMVASTAIYIWSTWLGGG